jgi:two-component system, chemotaxis family, CheB/CheR fusion protein
MAYIIVQHLSKDHKSYLTSILAKTTKMKVQEIDDMELMKPDNVYVIPYNKGIKVTDGHIKLIPRSKDGNAVSIDILFSSLALTHKENVIGVILSGNLHDGTIGLKAIKDAGGMTFAQDASAKAQSMPQSAIASGVVDFVLSPEEIALEFIRLSKNNFVRHKIKGSRKEPSFQDNDPDLKTILAILHKEIHVDFSRYKMATVKRRIQNRILQSGAKTIREYAKLLVKAPKEIDILYKDLLINVTGFFRDKEVFQYVKTALLPKILKGKTDGEKIRIWIPACSTGEEAYTIAMLITELQDYKTKKTPVQIFATDLSDQAIHDARIGDYTHNDVKPISKERLARFFIKTGGHYRVNKEIREMCVFAPHNILRDPPFLRLDLISCRNLLIYFDAAAQKKALAIFHFALREGKYLMLGKSETVGTTSQFFARVNNRFTIFSKKKYTGISKVPELLTHLPRITPQVKNTKPISKKSISVNFTELDSVIDSVLLLNYVPACTIINKDMEILKFRGLTSPFLTHPSGNASLNILKMIRPEFAFELRSAIHKAIKTKQSIRKSDIEIKIGSSFRMMTLDVCPLKIEWDEPLLLIVFTVQEQSANYNENAKGGKNNSTAKDRRIKKQAEELNNAHAEMHSIIEARETAYEELQAANEEIVSTNEEFQSLNEELETSKEEIEATNEELTSTNDELRTRNEQLAEAYDFATAISETMHEPFLILEKDLRIKYANKAFYKKFMVLQKDTERKLLYELGNQQWDIPSLRELLENIIQKDAYFNDYEISHDFPDIGKKTMLLNARRIIQKTQNEHLILLAFTDISETTQKRKSEKIKLENIIGERTEELDQSYKKLEEKNVFLEKMNKELETFNFISSHDLQEPLRKIKNFATFLLDEEDAKLSKTGKQYLKRMQETVNRMQLLIEDLLAYSRVKNAKYNFEKVDLNAISKEVIADFKEAIKEKKAAINITGHCRANIISFQFRQVMQNLISNSLKFAHAKRYSRIVIKCETIKGSILKIDNLLPEINYCHISVSDNGIGFDPQYKERIFEVFQRLNEFDEYKGTGIGLAICKRIIENHNGIITATGKLNKGARFDIYIPAI